MKTSYQVHCNGTSLQVSRIGRIQLADNGLQGDARQTILLAIGQDCTPYIILTTNGDDSAVAWIDEDGEIEMVDNVSADWFESFDAIGSQEPSEWIGELFAPYSEGSHVAA